MQRFNANAWAYGLFEPLSMLILSQDEFNSFKEFYYQLFYNSFADEMMEKLQLKLHFIERSSYQISEAISKFI